MERRYLNQQQHDVFKRIGLKRCHICGKPIAFHCCNVGRLGINWFCNGRWYSI